MSLFDLRYHTIAENCNLLNVILGSLVVFISLYLWKSKRKYKLPPGPWGLPVVGYIPFLDKYPFETLTKLGKKYGNIYSINLGGSYHVILNDFEAMKEAFNNPAILDRPLHAFDSLPGGLGFAGHNGSEWIEQRRYAMKTLKDAGVGRTTWENNVEAEVEDFVQTLEEQGGKPYDVLESLSASVSNNITSIILGKRLLKGDPRRKKVDDGINAAIATFSGFDLVSFFPKIVRLLAIFGLSKHTDTFQRLSTFHNFIRSEMERRQKIPASEWNEEIFIDGYLTEIQKVQQKSAETFFNENNLIGTSQALMIGGSDTSRTFLIWLFIAMALYPDIQKKVQKEVDTVLGKDGKMMWSERSKVPFLYATMLETHRWKTVTPLGVIHSVSEDTVICGYDIPKGTNILPNQYAMHNDPKYWKDPEVFRPERFLNKDGSLISHRLDSYVPFSIGRRICPGEMIAMIEIFHYFTAIMQRFDIRPLESVPPILEGSFGATFQPMEQKLRFIPRA